MPRDHLGKLLEKGDEVVVSLQTSSIMGRIIELTSGSLSLAGGQQQPPAIAVVIEVIGQPQTGIIPGCFKLHKDKVSTQ